VFEIQFGRLDLKSSALLWSAAGDPMRVLLIHNPKAGSEEHTSERLLHALKEAKHSATYQSSKKKGIKEALRKKIDVALVAGGDGTVGKIARRLVKAQSKIPLSVLPLGTANNLARALGFDVGPTNVIAGLTKGKISSFDVGVARGPWGKRYFFEGAGAGLFADYLRAPKKKTPKSAKTKTAEMRHHTVQLARYLRDYPAQKWKIELDGKDFSGRYLLCQAMNIPSVGPVLTLAAEAKSNDGKFDFVAAREEDRALLLKYLQARIKGKNPDFPLPVRRFKTMRLRWKKSPVHFDDEVWPKKSSKTSGRFEAEISVCDSALRIWKTSTPKRKAKKKTTKKIREQAAPRKSTLETLDEILSSEDVRAQIRPIVGRVRADLWQKPDAVMTWEPIPLEIFGENLPEGIKSSWVFVLRAGTNTGPERHPNSHQRMMSFEGGGDMQTGELDVWRSNTLTSDPGATLEQRWVSIPVSVWHQPVVPNDSDWAVVSFHTVVAEDLVEERPDEIHGATRQMKYLEQHDMVEPFAHS
jgi:diacylglycerol kinase (ATP)